MGGSGGGGSAPTQTQTVQKADPWSQQQPGLETVMGLQAGLAGIPTSLAGNLPQAQQEAFNAAGEFASSPRALQYYPGQTVAPFAPETETALQMQTQRALMGSPLEQAAQQQNLATTSGAYLSAGNPYFQQMAGRVTEQVMPQVQSQFAASGRTGSGLASRALGIGLGDAIGALAYQNYGAERGRQQEAAMAAPELAKIDYERAAALGEVGQAREGLAQQQINEAVERFNFQQMEPYQRLGLYNQAIQGQMGGTTTGTSTQQVPQGSRLGSIIGGAALGGGLLSMLG